MIENDLTTPAALIEGTVTVTVGAPGHAQAHLTIVHADPGVSELPVCGNEARLLEATVAQTAGAVRSGELRPLQCVPD